MEERLGEDDSDADDAAAEGGNDDGDGAADEGEGDEGDAEGADVLLLSTSPFNNSCMALALSIKPVKT